MIENKAGDGTILSEQQKRELDRRYADHENGNGKTYTWEETIAIADRALKERNRILKL